MVKNKTVLVGLSLLLLGNNAHAMMRRTPPQIGCVAAIRKGAGQQAKERTPYGLYVWGAAFTAASILSWKSLLSDDQLEGDKQYIMAIIRADINRELRNNEMWQSRPGWQSRPVENLPRWRAERAVQAILAKPEGKEHRHLLVDSHGNVLPYLYKRDSMNRIDAPWRRLW